MLDLLVHGGHVVTPDSDLDADIGIHDGKIVSITVPGQTPRAQNLVDATGKLVVPGGIEPHAHLSHYISMRTESEMYTLGPEDDTVGMAFGGVTTHLDFAQIYPGAPVRESIERRMDRWKGKSLIDYAFHVNFMGAADIDAFDHVPELIQSGFASFKVFTCNVLPPRPPRRSYRMDFGRIGHLMEKVASAGGIMVVHGEDDDIVQFNYELFTRDNRTHGANLHLVHSKLSELLSFTRTVQLAKARGAAVYFVHTSAREGVDVIRKARARGEPIYAETLHQYLCHVADEYAEPGGFQFHTYPSVKLAEDQAALWEGLLQGGICTVGTDEFPTSREVKLMGSSIEDVTGGNLGAEARMGIVYTEGVSKRGMSLRRYVDVTSTNAARILGLYPRKGAIQVGSDADLAILDTSLHRKLTRADFHVADYSPWEGWEITAWPSTTILRGKVIVDRGQLYAAPGNGQWLPRKIDAEVVQHPAC